VTSAFVHPLSYEPLEQVEDAFQSSDGSRFPIINGVPRFCEPENYTSSFGKQWNLFEKTQIDREISGEGISARRLFAETRWDPASLNGIDILEVGSGAGRFSRAILQHTRANLYSVDYSSAVEANHRNNAKLGSARFWLAQASIYEMPFPDDRFDKVLCLGVLQHTPDFERSIASLIAKAKPGGEIVVDFYAIRGWWTRVHAKYLFRPFTKRMDHEALLRLIDRNLDRLIASARLLHQAKLGVLTRFLPLVDLRTIPRHLPESEKREWALLDTFDMFSPEHDHPQRIESVARMFKRNGADVTFAGYLEDLDRAAVVRAVKRK